MLKVRSPRSQENEPPMDMGMPPMDAGMPPMENGNMAAPPMGNDPNMGGAPQPPMNNGGAAPMPNAPIEDDAEENPDPKKEIQSLAGKLSQRLNDYNTQLPQPDSGLNKYVSSMIAKQAVKGMSQEDVQYVIDKLQSDEDTDHGMGDPIAEPPQGGEGMPPQGDGQPQMPPPQQPPMNEAYYRKRMLDEIFQELTRPTDAMEMHQEMNMDDGYTSKPWKSPF